MSLDFLAEYYLPVVLAACLIVGYCIKHITWLKAVSNQYIPSILAILGAILACVANSRITLETIVFGAFTGLASTGMHQVFKQIIENSQSK